MAFMTYGPSSIKRVSEMGTVRRNRIKKAYKAYKSGMSFRDVCTWLGVDVVDVVGVVRLIGYQGQRLALQPKDDRVYPLEGSDWAVIEEWILRQMEESGEWPGNVFIPSEQYGVQETVCVPLTATLSDKWMAGLIPRAQAVLRKYGFESLDAVCDAVMDREISVHGGEISERRIVEDIRRWLGLEPNEDTEIIHAEVMRFLYDNGSDDEQD